MRGGGTYRRKEVRMRRTRYIKYERSRRDQVRPLLAVAYLGRISLREQHAWRGLGNWEREECKKGAKGREEPRT